MSFWMTLAEHLAMAASASKFYIAIDYENKPNMKVAANNVNIKMHHCFLNSEFLVSAWPLHSGKRQWAWHELVLKQRVDHNVIMILKLNLICVNNSLFNFFIKMKNEKRTVIRFPFFYENGKRMKVLKSQR